MLYTRDVLGDEDIVQYASVTWASLEDIGSFGFVYDTDSCDAASRLDGFSVPYSVEYSDVYFSKSGGVEQSEGVFLRGNDLAMRWSGSPLGQEIADTGRAPFCEAGGCPTETTCEKDIFVVGELGFGTGLNFINTCALWERCLACHNRHEVTVINRNLHYLAFENRPLTHFDALRIYRQIARLVDLKSGKSSGFLALSEKYNIFPVLHNLAGKHEFSWPDERITLTLFLGDVCRYLPYLDHTECSNGVDAWYLDGFSPKANPSIFCGEVYRNMAKLSASGATIASYTVSRSVRDGLAEAGFKVRKIAGVGSKREVLCGQYCGG